MIKEAFHRRTRTMTAPANALFAGHRHLDRLLNVLQRQLDAFEHGLTPDMALMRDLIDCLNRYAVADEGELIDEMAREDDRFAPARVVLTTEHQILAGLGERCLAVLDDITDDRIVTRSTLTIPMRRLIRLFRAHIEREHGYVCRHRATGLAGVRSGSHRGRRRQQQALAQTFSDLQDRMRRATATTRRDSSGTLVCRACAVET